MTAPAQSLERRNLATAARWALSQRELGLATSLLTVLTDVEGREGGTDLEPFAQLADATSTDDARAAALLLHGRAYLRSGQVPEARRAVDSALGLAVGSGLTSVEAEARIVLSSILWRTAQPDAAMEHAVRALEIATRLGSAHGCAHAENRQALILWNRGELENAKSAFERSIAHWGDSLESAMPRGELGLVHADLGEFDAAERCYREAIDAFRALGDRVNEGLMLTNLGTALNSQGKFSEALELWNDALELHELTGDARATALVLLNLGSAEVDHGELTRGREYLQRSLAEFESVGERRFVSIARGSLALAHALLGDFAAAEPEFAEALAFLEEIGDRFALSSLHTKLGRFELRRGRRDEAEAHLERARELAVEIGAGPDSTLANQARTLQLELDKE